MAQITVYDKTTGQPISVDETWIERWPDDFDLTPRKGKKAESAPAESPTNPGEDDKETK